MINGISIEEYLRQKGVNPSYQRIRILECLVNSKSHPSAEDVYKELIKEIPTLSKTTVYNTLELFADKGLVLTLSIDGNQTRYDGNTLEHGHFICESCNRVYDFLVDTDALTCEGLDGFVIKEKHFYLRGICSSCV